MFEALDSSRIIVIRYTGLHNSKQSSRRRKLVAEGNERDNGRAGPHSRARALRFWVCSSTGKLLRILGATKFSVSLRHSKRQLSQQYSLSCSPRALAYLSAYV